jgi:hypothetical protein
MIALIEALAEKGKLALAEAARILHLSEPTQLDDYRGFLASGGFVEVQGKILLKAGHLDALWAALKTPSVQEFGTQLTRVPSFGAFVIALSEGATTAHYGIAERALPTYIALAEASALAVAIPDERIYPTPANPRPDEFSRIALKVYSSIAKATDDYVLTGLWLEALAREHGIHPIVARDRLEEARIAGHIQRFTEGSTPETRYARHAISTLQIADGHPTIRRVSLFEGDFLLPGKSSVSLRLVRPTS